MNINFRKSLRRSSKSSTFYLESFEMFDRTLKHLSWDDVNRFTGGSVPIINFRDNESLIPSKPYTSVLKYDLNSERSTGTVGQIVLTNFRLKFIAYSHDSKKLSNGTSFNEESKLNGNQQFNFPPFELIVSNKTDEDVEYLNIYDLIPDQNMLKIYCSDFRCLEFQFKTSALARSLADQLERLIIKPIGSPVSHLSSNISSSISTINIIASNNDFELAYFWKMIAYQYQFSHPKDWESNEAHWYFTNSLLRISQANENYQLCKSLPASFITLKYYLTDLNLLQNISAKMRGQRVPIITYSHKCKPKHKRIPNRFDPNRQIEKDNMLIRSSIMNKEVISSLNTAIDSLKIIDVNQDLPDVQNFEKIYFKLREACFIFSNTTHFFSQIGKWLKLVCKVLSVVNDLSKILEEESSLLLMENSDNHWNILLSCLIQIILDKKRRTIEGFNSLLSKEWIYLIGLQSSVRLDRNKLPSPILFTLFLDCVYQILYQNPNEFEFTSLYLIRCLDLSYIPYSAFDESNSPTKQEESKQFNHLTSKFQTMKQPSPVHFSRLSSANNSFNINNSFQYHQINNSTKKILSPILKNLKFTQTLFYYNPFYDRHKQANSKLTLSSSILSVQFWRPLYLRWSKPSRNLEYYNQFHVSEYLYFRELITSSSGLKQVVQLANEEKVIDTDDNLEDSFEHF